MSVTIVTARPTADCRGGRCTASEYVRNSTVSGRAPFGPPDDDVDEDAGRRDDQRRQRPASAEGDRHADHEHGQHEPGAGLAEAALELAVVGVDVLPERS